MAAAARHGALRLRALAPWSKAAWPPCPGLWRPATFAGSPETGKRDTRSRTAEGIPLPEGWQEVRSPAKGVYYAHVASGVTQWDLPKGPPSKAQVAAAYRDQHGEQVAQLHPGAKVRLVNLKFAPQLSGKMGTCEHWDFSSGMVRIRLDSGELKAVKPENLMVIEDSAQRAQAKASAAEDEAEPGAEAEAAPRSRSWPSLLTHPLVVASAITLSGAAIWAWRYFAHETEAEGLRQEASAARAKAALEAKRWRAEADARAKAATAAVDAAPAASAVTPLPPGWRETVDTGSGRLYYWTEADPAGSVTWVRPV